MNFLACDVMFLDNGIQRFKANVLPCHHLNILNHEDDDIRSPRHVDI